MAGRLDVVLATVFGDLTRTRCAALVRGGAVRVDGTVRTRPSTQVALGAALYVEVPPPEPIEAIPEDLPVSIVYQDADLAVVNKAAGMVVHPAPGHATGTLVNALLYALHDLSGIGGAVRPGIVHRLDRGTSGLLVVAKNDRAHHGLSAQFAAHTAERRYWAVCLGEPVEDGGTVRSRVARHPSDRLRWASTERAVGKRAITHWRVVARAGTVTVVECRLETGRTHQIRVHLTEQGWPLMGDPVYRRRGRRPPATVRPLVEALDRRPLLHAWSLAFEHPVRGDRVRFTAPIPADMRAVLDALGLAELKPEGS